MRPWLHALTALPVMVVLASCARNPAPQPGGGGFSKGSNHDIRVFVRKEGGVCKSRTFPKHDQLWLEEEDTFAWKIQVKDNCLDGKDLVIKWTGTNPSACGEITTKKHGSKSKIECKWNGSTTSGIHQYKLYSRAEATDDPGADVLLEDPDVEIVM